MNTTAIISPHPRITLWSAIAALIVSSSILSAQSVWDGGGADTGFLTPENWSGDAAPESGTATTVQFAGSTNTNPSIDDDFQLLQLTFNSDADSFTLGGSGVLSVQGAGTSGISGSTQGITNFSTSLQTIDNALLLTGNVMVYAQAGAITLNGTISLNAHQLMLRPVSASTTLNVNGVIQGSSGTVVLRGTKDTSVHISGDNTFTTSSGGVGVWEGNVYLANNTALGNSANGVALGQASLTSNVALLTEGARSIAQNIRLISKTGAGTYTIGGSTADTSTYSGNIVVNTSGSSQKAMPLIVTAASDGRVNFTGNIVRDSASTGSADTLTKTGGGIVALAGSANSYSGATTVSAGTLLINGTLASGGGTVTVQSGAILGGSGTVNRDVAISNGAAFSAGDIDAAGASMAGTFSVVGNFTAGSSATFDFDLGALSDTVSVTGNLTLGGMLNVTALSGFTSGRYTLFSYTGSMLSNEDAFTLGSSLPGGYTYAFDYSVAHEVGLIVTSAIPEPATWAMILGGLALAAAAFRRRV